MAETDLSKDVKSVPLLTGGTWNAWNVEFQLVVVAKGYDDLLEDGVDVSTGENKKKNACVLLYMRWTIDGPSKAAISSKATAKEAYDTLKAFHGGAVPNLAIYNLLRQLFELKLVDKRLLERHVASFRNVHNALVAQSEGNDNLKIPDPVIAILLLVSVRECFSSLSSNYLANNLDVSTDAVYQRLQIDTNYHDHQPVREDVVRIKKEDGEEDGMAALTGKGKQQSKGDCRACKQFGTCFAHRIEDLENELARARAAPRSSSSAHKAQVEDESGAIVEVDAM